MYGDPVRNETCAHITDLLKDNLTYEHVGNFFVFFWGGDTY